MEKKLYKSRTNIKIDGVCAGLAKYTGIDVTLVRLAMVALVWFGGSGIPIYIVSALIIPREPKITVEEAHYTDNYDDRSN